MTIEKQEQFDPEAFKDNLSTQLGAWRKLWSPIANGTEHMPLWIAEYMDEPEELRRRGYDVWVPQQEAINRAMDYIAHELIKAGQTNQAREAYNIIFDCFSRLGEKSARTYFSLILPEILVRTLEVQNGNKKDEDNPDGKDGEVSKVVEDIKGLTGGV